MAITHARCGTVSPIGSPRKDQEHDFSKTIILTLAFNAIPWPANWADGHILHYLVPPAGIANSKSMDGLKIGTLVPPVPRGRGERQP